MTGKRAHTVRMLYGGIAAAIGIIAAVLLSEIILQIVDVPRRPVSGWLNCAVKNPGECNALGFRGSEMIYGDDDFVVVLLGDSEVYAASIPFHLMPERRLEYFLSSSGRKAKVFSIADMGYGQDQQYLALRKYFETYRADLVVLLFTARNDVENNIFPAAGGNNTIKPTFWLEKGELLGPTEGWLESAGPWIKLLLIWKSFIGPTPGEERVEHWKKHILPDPYVPLDHYPGSIDYSWHEGWKTSPEIAFKGIDYEMIAQGSMLKPRSDMRQYGIDLTRKLFGAIKSLAEAHKAHFVIVKEERPWELRETMDEKAYFLNGKYYILSIEQYRSTLNDLFSDFEHYEIPLHMEDSTMSGDDKHLNAEAVNELMNELSLLIQRKGYLRQS